MKRISSRCLQGHLLHMLACLAFPLLCMEKAPGQAVGQRFDASHERFDDGLGDSGNTLRSRDFASQQPPSYFYPHTPPLYAGESELPATLREESGPSLADSQSRFGETVPSSIPFSTSPPSSQSTNDWRESTEGYGRPTGAGADDASLYPHLSSLDQDSMILSPPESFTENPVHRKSDDLWNELDLDYQFLARGFYLNDQRIQWSGLEATFGAEGILDGTISVPRGKWNPKCYGEIYLNQPYDENIYIDIMEKEGKERPSYLANYRVDTFEISQLYLSFEINDFQIGLGKFRTPFGRYAFPLMTNARLFAPFIRTEAILWRETGLAFRYQPNFWVADVALLNGSEDKDTNSAKALIARLGVDFEWFTCGGSIKVQDGIGSEEQKMYNEHVGFDVLMRSGRWVFSSEVIYDQYGFRRSGYDPNEIFWPRSIYYRETNKGFKEPICGVGYYFDATYRGTPWLINLNYGEYYPEQLGIEAHDQVNRRGIFKVGWECQKYFQWYSALLIENDDYGAQCKRERRGWGCLAGLEIRL